MSTLYQAFVGTTVSGAGVTTWIDEGQRVELDGSGYVRTGRILSADLTGWHDTKSAAIDEAATQVEAIACRLHAQAQKLRREAEALRVTQQQEVTP